MTAQQPAKQVKKWPLVVVALVLLGVVSQCDKDKKEDKSSSTSSSYTTTTTWAPTSTAVAAAEVPTTTTPTGPVLPQGVTFNTEPGANGENVYATFKISDALFMGLTRKGAQLKTIDILKYAHATYPDAAAVFVQGTFPTKDAYGNSDENTIVLNVGYTQSTLNQINFDGVDSGKIWEIRDSGMVHPELQG